MHNRVRNISRYAVKKESAVYNYYSQANDLAETWKEPHKNGLTSFIADGFLHVHELIVRVQRDQIPAFILAFFPTIFPQQWLGCLPVTQIKTLSKVESLDVWALSCGYNEGPSKNSYMFIYKV